MAQYLDGDDSLASLARAKTQGTGRLDPDVTDVIQTAKLNGLDPHAYLKDVLTRLPTHPNNCIDELLPHN